MNHHDESTRPDAQQDAESLLALYVNDHLAGATAGVELCRHLSEVERSGPQAIGAVLARLAEEIDQDRSALLDIMDQLSIPARHYKVGAGWLSEKLARLVPHGSALGRTRLNTLVELETLRLGVEGKACLWRALAVLPNAAGDLESRLHGLLERAAAQASELEELRIRAAQAALAAPSN